MAVQNHYGMTFADEAEKQAWENYVEARIAASENSPILSHEQATAQTHELTEKLRYV